jgi:anthranilate 1,2-dioxygenase small subunit/terephthalate 1,2-dioxygenase oxygenase component beta subunit
VNAPSDAFLRVCHFNAAYAQAIDSDALERWPGFFAEACLYRVTHAEAEAEGLPAGLIYADSRAMLEDRVAALREANIYESQRYRHILGMPLVRVGGDGALQAETPFLVVRIMATGQSEVFASGAYHDRFADDAAVGLRLAERVVVCDSHSTDTLMALPL